MAHFENRLAEMSDDLVHELSCPECDGDLTKAEIVQILAADDVEKKSIETYKNTLGGAGLFATAGAIFGPPGIVAGGAVGSVLGGMRGQKRDELRRVKVRCPNCGHHGSAF